MLGDELRPEHDTLGTVLGDPCDPGGEIGGEQVRSFAFGDSSTGATTPLHCWDETATVVR